MNKKILFAAAAVCLCASCTEDFKDWADPQSSEAVAPAGFVSLSVSASGLIDLDQVTTDKVQLFTPSLSEGAIATGYQVRLVGDNLAKTYDLDADAQGNVSAEALNKAVVELFNRVREERVLNALVTGVAVKPLSDGEISVPVVGTFDCKVMVQTTAFAEFFYEIGGESGWSASHPLQSKECDGKYVGYQYLCDQFKFKPNADNWDDDLECVGEWKVGQGSDNCPVPEPALYRIELDLVSMTYSLTSYGVVSMIGEITGDSSWGTDIDMEYSTSEGCFIYTGEVHPGGFKFRANHDWSGVNWGGDDAEHLYMDAGNCNNTVEGMAIVRFWPSYSGNGRFEVEAL